MSDLLLIDISGENERKKEDVEQRKVDIVSEGYAGGRKERERKGEREEQREDVSEKKGWLITHPSPQRWQPKM